jgi:hypothetical protein
MNTIALLGGEGKTKGGTGVPIWNLEQNLHYFLLEE